MLPVACFLPLSPTTAAAAARASLGPSFCARRSLSSVRMFCSSMHHASSLSSSSASLPPPSSSPWVASSSISALVAVAVAVASAAAVGGEAAFGTAPGSALCTSSSSSSSSPTMSPPLSSNRVDGSNDEEEEEKEKEEAGIDIERRRALRPSRASSSSSLSVSDYRDILKPKQVEGNGNGVEMVPPTRKDIADRARAKLSWNAEAYDSHPCGKQLKGWHECVLTELGKDDDPLSHASSTGKDDSNINIGSAKNERELASIRAASLHRKCADPYLLMLLSCVKDERVKTKKRLVEELGQDGFRRLMEEHDRKVMSNTTGWDDGVPTKDGKDMVPIRSGYDLLKKRKEALERMDALVEAFKERENASSSSEEGVGVSVSASSEGANENKVDDGIEQVRWWQLWKNKKEKKGHDNGDDYDGTNGPVSEERKAEAEFILKKMKMEKDEREAAIMAEAEADATKSRENDASNRRSESSNENIGKDGKKKSWWRFGF